MDSSDGRKEAACLGPRRVPLPMSTGIRILPQQSAHLTGRSQLDLFCPDRLLIKNASQWNIDSLEVDASAIEEVGHRSGSAFSLVEWCPLPARGVACGEAVVLSVTYVGPNAGGEFLEAALFGWEGQPPVAIGPATDPPRANDRLSEQARSPEVATGEEVELPLRIGAPSLFVDRLTIADADSWIVNDVRVRGESIFVQRGEIPGEMFSAGGSADVILGLLAAGDLVEVVGTHVGESPTARLVVKLSGTPRPPRDVSASTLFLPMSSGVNILPAMSAQITGRPQLALVPRGSAFLPERVVLVNGGHWIINDVRAGVSSQFAQSGDVPGVAFSSRAVGCHVRFAPVCALQDFVMVSTYAGFDAGGAPFYCGVQGRLVRL